MNDPNDQVLPEIIKMLVDELVYTTLDFGEKHSEILSERLGFKSLIMSSGFSYIATMLKLLSNGNKEDEERTEEFLDGLFKYVSKSKGLSFSERNINIK